MPDIADARVGAEVLAGFIAAVLGARGVPAADAAVVAGLMTEADLTGADAHGIFRLPQYVGRLDAGGLNPRPRVEAKRTGAATGTVDGDNGLGHLAVARAVDLALELARDAGAAIVAVRRSNHAGPAGIYPARIADAGMIGLYTAVASANHMAPWGGAEMLLGTNPLAVAVPVPDAPPLVLDMATTAVSYDTIKKHAMAGTALEPGWMVSRATGEPITDPARTGEGALLPMGGYKGSALALVLGLLAGPLAGAAFGRDVVDFNADATTAANTGQLVIALDPDRFAGRAALAAEVERHLADLRASPPLPGAGPVRLPGDARAARRADRLANGVPIPAPLRQRLDALAARVGVPRLA